MDAYRGYSYRDKVAVVTGAGSGIGRALALRLAGEGARLAISDVTDGVAQTAMQCRERGAEVHDYRVDVSDRALVMAHAEQVVADLGRVDVAVNNAGVALSATVAETSVEDFQWLMGINFWGVVHGTQAFLPYLAASGDGRLVNISSIFGLIGVPKQAAYNSAKFAVRGFTEALRQEVEIDQMPVQVCCVHPGGIKTNIARSARVGASGDGNHVAIFDKIAVTSADGAAKAILRGAARGQRRILVGPDARVVAALPRLLGAAYQPLVVKAVRRAGY